MKRSDLTTLEVLSTVQSHGQLAGYFHLCEKYPTKIVDAAFEREVGNGHLDYGVTLRSAWLEPAGEMWLRAHYLGGMSAEEMAAGLIAIGKSGPTVAEVLIGPPERLEALRNAMDMGASNRT